MLLSGSSCPTPEHVTGLVRRVFPQLASGFSSTRIKGRPLEQLFESAEDMGVGGQAFSAMDSVETPGTRTSVDMCELKLEMKA